MTRLRVSLLHGGNGALPKSIYADTTWRQSFYSSLCVSVLRG